MSSNRLGFGNYSSPFQERREVHSDELKRSALGTLSQLDSPGKNIEFEVTRTFQPIKFALLKAAPGETVGQVGEAAAVAADHLITVMRNIGWNEGHRDTVLAAILEVAKEINGGMPEGRGMPSSLLLDLIGRVGLTDDYRRKILRETAREPSVPLSTFLQKSKEKNEDLQSPPRVGNRLEPPISAGDILAIVEKGGKGWGDCVKKCFLDPQIIAHARWCKVMFDPRTVTAVVEAGIAPVLLKGWKRLGSQELSKKTEKFIAKMFLRCPPALQATMSREVVLGYGPFVDPTSALDCDPGQTLVEILNRSTAESGMPSEGLLVAMACPEVFARKVVGMTLKSKKLSEHMVECARAVQPVMRAPILSPQGDSSAAPRTVLCQVLLETLEGDLTASGADNIGSFVEMLIAESLIDTADLTNRVLLPLVAGGGSELISEPWGSVSLSLIQVVVAGGLCSADTALVLLLGVADIIRGRDRFSSEKIEGVISLCCALVNDVLLPSAEAWKDNATSVAKLASVTQAGGEHMANLLFPLRSTAEGATGFPSLRGPQSLGSAPVGVGSLSNLLEFGKVHDSNAGEAAALLGWAMRLLRHTAGADGSAGALRGIALAACVRTLCGCTRTEFTRVCAKLLPFVVGAMHVNNAHAHLESGVAELLLRTLALLLSGSAAAQAPECRPRAPVDATALSRNIVSFIKASLGALGGAVGQLNVLGMVCDCMRLAYSTRPDVADQFSILVLDIMSSPTVTAAFAEPLQDGGEVCAECVYEMFEGLRAEHSSAVLERVREACGR